MKGPLMKGSLFLLCGLLLASVPVSVAQQGDSPHSVSISAGDLQAVFADNEEFPGHRAWYNGINVLRHRADTTMLFQPGVAGLNFEHIFDGQKWTEPAEVLFEPRSSPMSIERSGENSVLLHQPPTKLHQLESWTRFTVSAPHYIDMEFKCVPRAETFDRGYIGLFWASYINTHVSREYYFIGRKPGETNNRWLAFISPEHNEKSSVRWVEDTQNPTFADTYPRRLFNDYSQYGYSYPFYYGRRGDMLIMLMFDQAGPLRFSHSPSSGGRVTPRSSPAWDFHYLIYDYKVGQEYGFKARLVYKPFVSEQDIITEYESWSGNKVELGK
ncbi:MAG: hypothetical protein V1794_01425 [Candidatus Glassbacteria bacterium]